MAALPEFLGSLGSALVVAFVSRGLHRLRVRPVRSTASNRDDGNVLGPGSPEP